MEILSGMILLLQVVISIQIMLVGKQVLQRIGVLEGNFTEMVVLPDKASTVPIKENGTKKVQQTFENGMSDRVQALPENPSGKESQEALINEVLSEVFS